MNLAIIVNEYNLPHVRAFIEKAAELQTQKCEGAVAVVYQQRLGAEFIKELLAPISHLFAKAVSLPVSLNYHNDNNARNSTLFAMFVSQFYALFPGPWLVVDDAGVPRVPNFIQAAHRQHKALGGKATGRGTFDGSGLTPVGPVVLEFPIAKLSWFSPSLTESWRARSRYLMSRNGFRIVAPDEYLYSIPKAVDDACFQPAPRPEKPVIPPPVSNPAESTSAAEEPPPVRKVEPKFSIGDLVVTTYAENNIEPDKVVDVGLWPDGSGVQLSRGGIYCQNDLEAVLKSTPGSTPEVATNEASVVSTDESASTQPVLNVNEPGVPYDQLDREVLFVMIEGRGLQRPHHATGTPKLVSILEADDASKANS